MELSIHRDKQIVAVWLTQADRKDDQVQERLKQLYDAYRESGFQVAVFQSGEQDLTELTSALLCKNRRDFAVLQAQAEKRQNERSA